MYRPARSLRRKLRSVLRRGLRRFGADQRGAIAVMFALSLGAVAGTLALSYELGEAWTVQTELKNAADAAALAAASQLDREPGAIARAKDIAVDANFAGNAQTFADGAAAVAIARENVTVYATLADAQAQTNPLTEGTDDAIASYVRVETGPREVGFAFALLTGDTAGASPNAFAIAGNTSAYCKVPHMLMCIPAAADGGLAGLQPGIGVWMKGKAEGNGALGPGNFGLLELLTADGTVKGAAALGEAMAKVNPLAQCLASDGSVRTRTGEVTGQIQRGLNMRFDIYPLGNPPELTDPQYRPSPNTVKGLVRTGGQCGLAPSGWRVPPDTYDGPGQHDPNDLSTNPIDAMGYPRDECSYPTGSGTCIPSGQTGRFGNGDWDRDVYFAVNHPTVTPDTARIQVNGSAYADSDTANLSRWETHQWELDTGRVPHVGSANFGELGDPLAETGGICSPHAVNQPSELDRRVITVAAVDCEANTISGPTNVMPEAFYNLFLTEPVGVGPFSDNKTIYAEVIGEAESGRFQQKVSQRVIQLYE